MSSPTHSPSMKRRCETEPAAYRNNSPDGLPPRRVSSVDVASVHEKLESLRNEQQQDNKRPMKRRTTVATMCPIFKATNLKRAESFDEAENDDEETVDDNSNDVNGEALLIGIDEESLTELVELTQKIETTL